MNVYAPDITVCFVDRYVFVLMVFVFFFLRIRRPPISTQSRSSAASDVYKRQGEAGSVTKTLDSVFRPVRQPDWWQGDALLSLIHISEHTRLLSTSYAVFCLKKTNIQTNYP